MTPLDRLAARYRASGADLPFGDPRRRHGVSMEGYFWRFTEPATGRVLIALIGIQTQADGDEWALVGFASHPTKFLSVHVLGDAGAAAHRASAWAGDAFRGDEHRVRIDLEDVQLDVSLTETVGWPHRAFGGSSVFQSVPGLNQYWHPWLLGGRANGTATFAGETWNMTDAQVYAEKNWGRGGFPESWWWGQAQGFTDPEACVAFAGGQIHAGPLRTEVTAVVVRLPDGTVFRLGNPVTSPVTTTTTDETWRIRGRSARWRVAIDAGAPLAAAHVLPVPIVEERRAQAGDIEHLAGALAITVWRDGRVHWRGETRLAALEHGGLDRAAAELQRRGLDRSLPGAPPV